jgi:NUC194 domain
LHKSLYGKASPGTELTKSLIGLANNAKKDAVYIAANKDGEQWISKMKEEKSILPYASFEKQQVKLSSAAYCCLAVVINKTQTKEILFSQFLFLTNKGDKEEPLWENIISDKVSYNFKVETNFDLQNKKDAKSNQGSSMNENISESLFDSDAPAPTILFESQRILLSASEMVEQIKSSPEQNSKPLELDKINSNPCMQRIIEVINNLHKLFASSWKAMPQWMQSLYAEIGKEKISVNVRLFILKIVLNL